MDATIAGIVIFVFVVFGALLWLALVIVALVSIIRSTRLSTLMKILWGAIVFFFPFLGTILWFLIGRKVNDVLS